MGLSRRQVAAITHQRRLTEVKKDAALERQRMSLAVSGDPQDVADWSASLVAARLGPDGKVYCVACAPRRSMHRSTEPEVVCAGCGGRVGAVQ